MQRKRTVLQSLPLNKVKGDLGIEIECETSSLESFPSVIGWTQTADGSLRGNSVEYVSHVLSFNNYEKSLDNLKLSLGDNNISLNTSIRTGIHVHFNFQQHTLDDIVKFVCLYSIFERGLLRYCGSNREYNLFCRPLIESNYVASLLWQAWSSNNFEYLNTDNIRYCALNLRSLHYHGTIEFRAMQTSDDFEAVKNWIKLLKKVYDASQKYEDVEEMLESYSLSKLEDFKKDVFGDMSKLVKTVDDEMREGMRYAQDLNYGSV